MADWENWTNQFKQDKYNKTRTGIYGEGRERIVNDGADAYANLRGMQLSFMHVPTNKAVYFKAFIVAFNETFNSDWNQEQVFGRTDPIMMYKGTQRQISLNFKVPAFSEGEAYENLGRIQKLAQYLYPSYTDLDRRGQRVIAQSPLIRMKVLNLAQDQSKKYATEFKEAEKLFGNPDEQAATYFNGYKSSNNAGQGLLGVIRSMQVDHNIEAQGVLEKGFNTVLPKLLDVAVTFDVIHEQTMGFDQQGYELAPLAPYGVELERPYELHSQGKTFDQLAWAAEREIEGRLKREQDVANAEARYAGMFGRKGLFGIGGGRAGRDRRRAEKGKLNPYEASAWAGENLGADSYGHGATYGNEDGASSRDIWTDYASRNND